MEIAMPLHYDGSQVRVLMDESGEPWWVASDVCQALELTNNRVALQALDPDERDARPVVTAGGE